MVGTPPSRTEIEDRLVELLGGKQSREEAADWAPRWIRAEEPRVDDPAVWKALSQLAGADPKTIDRPYLHEDVDFLAWLEELQARSARG
jgi:hypothetical protein